MHLARHLIQRKSTEWVTVEVSHVLNSLNKLSDWSFKDYLDPEINVRVSTQRNGGLNNLGGIAGSPPHWPQSKN
jgi:hypothetical protein